MRILLDCRWLTRGGAGRATELLLRGLKVLEPKGKWVLWGPRPTLELSWPDADVVVTERDPREWWGQRAFRLMPDHDAAIFLHQIRPWTRSCSVTFIHDTIPIRYGGPAISRKLKRAYFRQSARLSTRIVTVSEFSRQSIVHDLGIDPKVVRVIRYPSDTELAERVRRFRRALRAENFALYVGRFATHKNLPRLVEAFARSTYSARGGSLRLVGGTAEEVDELSEAVVALGADNIDVEGTCSEDRLEQLYATARFLVMPSLEEGFGLPVWEALQCGLPVCCSRAGSLPELVPEGMPTFAPDSVEEMRNAIDLTATIPTSDRPLVTPSSAQDFAKQVVDIVDEALRSGAGKGATWN